MLRTFCLLAGLLGATLGFRQNQGGASRPAPTPDRAPTDVAKELTGDQAIQRAFEEMLAKQGVVIDRKQGVVALRGQFNSPKQPLEYLVTAPRGSHYESLIAIAARPSDVAAALLSLGVDQGSRPRRMPREKKPDTGAPPVAADPTIPDTLPFVVEPGKGGGVFLYVEWNDDRGFHRHRIEDLVFERPEGRTIKHERFVFSNSLMLQPRSKREVETYAANADGNFASCGFAGEPVLAYPSPHPMAMEGDFEIYQPNWTLVPSEPCPVTLLLAKEELEKPLVPEMAPPPASAPAKGPTK